MEAHSVVGRVTVLWLTLALQLSAQENDAFRKFAEIKAKAEQGDAEAQFNLGLCYSDSVGVPQDYVEAAKWFRRAADQGVAEAQLNFGFCYYKG